MPTRAETQAATRARLVEAADALYARDGVGTSIREITRHAGFTRGAFYANFARVEDLFLAVLTRRFEQRLARLEEESDARAMAAGWVAHLDADRDWHAAFLELTAHAGRTPSFRVRYAERYAELRRRMAATFAARLPEPAPIAPDRLAAMAFVLANGLAVERLIDPDVADADLYAELIELLALGLSARRARPAGAGRP